MHLETPAPLYSPNETPDPFTPRRLRKAGACSAFFTCTSLLLKRQRERVARRSLARSIRRKAAAKLRAARGLDRRPVGLAPAGLTRALAGTARRLWAFLNRDVRSFLPGAKGRAA